MDLQHLVDDLEEPLGAGHLHDRGLDRVLLDRLHHVRGRAVRLLDGRVDGAGCAIGHRLVGVDLGRRARELLADQAELADRSSELLALRGVRDGALEHVLHAADAEGRELQPADVQDVERDLMPFADFAEDVLHRHLAILEDQRRRRAAADPELVLLAALREAGHAALDDHRGELVPVDLEEDDVHVGEAAVRDPHLPAVHDVMAAVGRQPRDRPRAERIGAAARFR